MQVTQDALSLPRLQVTVIHRNQDEATITGRALCSLVLDWVRKQMEEEELQLDCMKEKVRCLVGIYFSVLEIIYCNYLENFYSMSIIIMTVL